MKSPLLLLAVALPLFTAPTPSRGGMLTGDIEVGITVEIVDVLQAPATSGSPPLARLNVLAEAPDGSGRLFVNDLRGPLYVIDGATLTTYLDFDTLFPDLKTSPGLASGFVSFAFHPDFASNGLFYTVHSEAENGSANLGPALPTTIDQHSILTEFTATIPAANGFSGSRRELMRIASPHSFHNLGKLAFDPNLLPGHPDYGLLYIGGGDFGSVAIGEPEQLQRLDTPFGTVMRIDPLGGPFLRGGTSYAYGIRPAIPTPPTATRTPSTRSSCTACATPTVWSGTRQATAHSSSPTSARATSRSWTSRRVAPTTAGQSARAPAHWIR
jgi:hypothetical protein